MASPPSLGTQLYKSLCTVYTLFHCKSTKITRWTSFVCCDLYKANTRQQNGIIKPRSKVPLKITAIFIDSFDIKSFIKPCYTYNTFSFCKVDIIQRDSHTTKQHSDNKHSTASTTVYTHTSSPKMTSIFSFETITDIAVTC